MKTISTKTLAIGLIIGLIIGLAIGYVILPKGVDTTTLEQQVTQLEVQVKNKDTTISNLEAQISSLQGELQVKTNQLDELQTKLSGRDAEIANLKTQIADLEAQISTLQGEVDELKELVPPYRKGEWNLIETFKGSSSMTTDYFYIAGADIRINWTWTSGVPKYASFSFSLYKEGETTWTVFEFDLDSIGTTHVHNLKTANYYLEISEANIDEWTITVEVWIPDQAVERGYKFFRENLWDEAKGAYRECPLGSGLENNYWGDDNYLALIFHRDYERFKGSERANRIQQFLEKNPPRLELGLRRWCVLSADNYTQYQPYNNWEYTDQVALDGIYYARIGDIEKAKECFNYLIEKMYRNGFIEDEATPENGHEYYKLALSLFLAHHLKNEDPKANRYIPILTEKLLDLQRPNGSWLTDDKPPSWPNTETTILILIAFKS